MHPEVDKNKIKKALYVVSTPIGNLNDITLRALTILRNSDYILCEDTRVSKKLLNFYSINAKLLSNHKFNEKKNLSLIKKLFFENKVVSLISDAGTPSISDPGKIMIDECIKNNIEVIPIPGVSAVTTSMSISNFSNNFYFHGFISEKKKNFEDEIDFMSKLHCSIVFFVSSKKLLKILNILKNKFKKRKILICKELTKYYEQFLRAEMYDVDKFQNNIKGEITVVISDKKPEKKNIFELSESDKIKIDLMINKMSVRDIVKILGQKRELSKSTIYNYCIRLKNEK